MNEDQTLTIKFRGEYYQELMRLARELNTDPVDIIEKALVLLKKVQGKKIILKEDHSTLVTEINLFARPQTK